MQEFHALFIVMAKCVNREVALKQGLHDPNRQLVTYQFHRKIYGIPNKKLYNLKPAVNLAWISHFWPERRFSSESYGDANRELSGMVFLEQPLIRFIQAAGLRRE
jgi:hypothetical protein